MINFKVGRVANLKGGIMKCPKCGSDFVVVTDYDDNYFDCHDCGHEFCIKEEQKNEIKNRGRKNEIQL